MAVGEKLKKKKTTAADLPGEVIQNEILTRLPIKSVARFKSVSKSWLSLFSDPQFVKEHNSAAQNPNDYDCLVAQKSSRIFILSRYKETFILPSDNYKLIGSINGLVCLSNGRKFSLWNPAIYQSKEFTHSSGHYCVLDHIGFGFDRVSNDYKIVVLSMKKRSAIVYCSKSDSWIDIRVPDNVFPKNRAYNSNRLAVIAKDCPYWALSRYTSDRHSGNSMRTVLTAVYFSVVKFNAGSNEFKLLPELYIDISAYGASSEFHFQFVDMKDCLTLIMCLGKSSNCMVDIYSLDGEDERCGWIKMYNVGPLDFRTRNMYVSPVQGFKYGDEMVFHEYGMFFCYDHKTLKIKRLVGTSSSESSLLRCFRYVPSLVFLEGMKSVHLITQSRTHGLCYRTPRRLINSLRN